jgi:hypothetical protein
MSKAAIEHKDKLGRNLKIGDCVAYPSTNSLEIGTIKKVTPKMTVVVKVGKKSGWGSSGSRKYPSDLILVEGPEVTMYLLKMDTVK